MEKLVYVYVVSQKQDGATEIFGKEDCDVCATSFELNSSNIPGFPVFSFDHGVTASNPEIYYIFMEVSFFANKYIALSV